MVEERQRTQALVALVRQRLEAVEGQPLPEERVPLGRKEDGTVRQHRFDLVAPNRSFVGEVRTYSLGEGSNRPAGKFAHCYAACLFLYRAKARRRVLVLTDRDFWARFRRESDGLVQGVEIVHVPVDPDAPLLTNLPAEPAAAPRLAAAPRPTPARRPGDDTGRPRRNRGGPGPAGRRPNTGQRGDQRPS